MAARLLGATLLACLALLLPAGAALAAGEPTCEGSLQARIDAASPGATVRLARDCVYREQVTVGKPLTLDGGGIRGSDVWKGWRAEGPLWTSVKTVPELAVPDRVVCEAGGARCRWPAQVFLDGEALTQVAANPQPGQCALGEGRRVLLADDPSGSTL